MKTPPLVEVPKRIRLSRKKGFRLPPNTVVVSRPSKWGNPFRIGDDFGAGPIDASTATELFRVDGLTEPIRKQAIQLRGKHLACWCPESSHCHADVLLKLANE